MRHESVARFVGTTHIAVGGVTRATTSCVVLPRSWLAKKEDYFAVVSLRDLRTDCRDAVLVCGGFVSARKVFIISVYCGIRDGRGAWRGRRVRSWCAGYAVCVQGLRTQFAYRVCVQGLRTGFAYAVCVQGVCVRDEYDDGTIWQAARHESNGGGVRFAVTHSACRTVGHKEAQA